MNLFDAAPRRIAICADDYGLDTAVDDAVLELAAAGRISVVSCMTGGRSWDAGAPRLRELDEATVDAGLHLDLTEATVHAASRKSLKGWIAASWLGRVDRAALREEIDVQLDRFEAGLKRPPAHVDGHQHVHQFPIVRDLLVEALVRRYPQRLPWLRASRTAAPPSPLKLRIIETLGAAATAQRARKAGIQQNRGLLGVYGFDDAGVTYSWRLGQWMQQARDGDLLVCHPAKSAVPRDPIAAARVREYGVFASEEFGRRVRDFGLVIEPMSRILGPKVPP